MRATIALTGVILGVSVANAAVYCRGDCNHDGDVSVDELVTGVGIALSIYDLGACPAFGPAPVDVTSLVAGIQGALEGCPADPCVAADDVPDHGRACFEGREGIFAYASRDQGRAAVKFNITEFRDRRRRGMRYLESEFYRLHDEWYWFRLLNGHNVPGDTTPPVSGLRFDSIDEIYRWAVGEPSLPLDLEFSVGRLGSQRFYRLALEDPRSFGIGTLLHIPPSQSPPRQEKWLFELEYEDQPTHPVLKVFFEMLAATLPAEVGDRVLWLVRSPSQEQLAQRMEKEHLAYFDRIVRTTELASAGEVEVYSEGVAAGRFASVSLANGDLDLVDSRTVIALDQVPDSVPAVAAVLTATPQVPLAHVSLLARSRGTPDVYVGGLFEDPFFQGLAAENALVAVRARRPAQLDIVRITADDYDEWQRLSAPEPASVAQVELRDAPYVIELDRFEPVDADRLRPLIGGKATGEIFLRAAAGVTSPDLPLAVTIRAYAEHISSLRPTLETMLADPAFRDALPIRYLALEGPAKYDARYKMSADAERKAAFLAMHPAGDLVGDMVRGGGIKAAIEAKPMATETLAIVRAALEARFADFDVTQGIRFRSSSTVEDIEGFTGAGLYDSNTGFLDAAAQASSSDRKKTVESAIKKTWASYWNSEAFEERRIAAIDHLSGNMGLLVHARADDSKELANGVITLSRYPVDAQAQVIMDVNVQAGATSVTNPQPGDGQAEVDRVTRVGSSGSPAVERVQRSSRVADGEVVLSDEQLLALLGQAEAVANLWQDERNADLAAEQAWRGVALDFETRWMAAGWPALKPGLPPHDHRLLLKQVRSLDPGARGFDPLTTALAIPRDVLVRARRIERVRCADDAVEIQLVRVLTDPLLAPDLGFSDVPFLAEARARALADLAELGLMRGDEFGGAHTLFRSVEVSPSTSEAWPTRARFDDGAIEIQSPGHYRLEIGGGAVESEAAACRSEVIHTAANDFLGRLIDGFR